MSLVLLIVLLLLVVGGLPNWGYHQYGYGPSGIGGVILLILVILLLTGRV
jgi:flagellin-like protein